MGLTLKRITPLLILLRNLSRLISFRRRPLKRVNLHIKIHRLPKQLQKPYVFFRRVQIKNRVLQVNQRSVQIIYNHEIFKVILISLIQILLILLVNFLQSLFNFEQLIFRPAVLAQFQKFILGHLQKLLFLNLLFLIRHSNLRNRFFLFRYIRKI